MASSRESMEGEREGERVEREREDGREQGGCREEMETPLPDCLIRYRVTHTFLT